MDPEKIKVIRGWPPPTTVHEVQQFIDLCGFYQQFVEGFHAVAAPLTAMFKADFEWEWTAVHQASFAKLKQAMINATHLSAIDPQQPYHLYMDASKDCVGGTLAQQCAYGKYKGHLRTYCLPVAKDAICRNSIPDSRTGVVGNRASSEAVVSSTSRTTAGTSAH